LIARRWRRSLTGSLVVLLVALAAAYDRGTFSRSGVAPDAAVETGPSLDLDRYHDREFRVAHVVDGDTLDLEVADGVKPRTRVRLWGVDAPELQRGDDRSLQFGREAADFARVTLEGRDVYIALSPHQTRDKYNRLLAYVFLERGGVLFNELLIEQGYAQANRRFPHAYRERFASAEKHAKKNRRGLWRE
jgi:micrococcal nuclease